MQTEVTAVDAKYKVCSVENSARPQFRHAKKQRISSQNRNLSISESDYSGFEHSRWSCRHSDWIFTFQMNQQLRYTATSSKKHPPAPLEWKALSSQFTRRPYRHYTKFLHFLSLIEKMSLNAAFRRVNFRGANNHEISIQSLEVALYTRWAPSIIRTARANRKITIQIHGDFMW